MFTRKPRLQLEKFAINGAERLLQHNLPEPDFYVDRILRTPLSSVPPCQFGSLAGLEHGRTIPFSDIGLSTGAFVLGNPQIRCRQHCGLGVHNRAVCPQTPVTMRLPSRLNAALQTSSSCAWAKTPR
jgi:hypothetical protein